MSSLINQASNSLGEQRGLEVLIDCGTFSLSSPPCTPQHPPYLSVQLSWTGPIEEVAEVEEDLHTFGLAGGVHGAGRSSHNGRNRATSRRGGRRGHAVPPMNRGKATPAPPLRQPSPTRNCSEQFTRTGPKGRDVRGGAGHEAAIPRALAMNVDAVSKLQCAVVQLS